LAQARTYSVTPSRPGPLPARRTARHAPAPGPKAISRLRRGGRGDGPDGELTLEVALVEDLGSDSYIYGHLAGDADSHVIVRATRDHPRPGETVKVKVDTAHLHLFDGATGLRVGE